MGNNLCCDAHINDGGSITRSKSSSSDEEFKNYLQKYPKVASTLSILKKQKSALKQKQATLMSSGVYIGKINQGNRNGFGLMLYQQGYFYEGEWQNNMKNGKGFMIDKQGDYYNGPWINNFPTGIGLYESKQPKRKYEGQWFQGNQNGQGIEEYEDGCKYQGEFEKGKKHGKGKIVYDDATYYEGQFKQNIIQGYGISQGANHRYQGDWKNGKMDGTGKSQWFDNEGNLIATYVGQYIKGIKHGFGEYRWAKDQVYKGMWQNGEIKNVGVLVNYE